MLRKTIVVGSMLLVLTMAGTASAERRVVVNGLRLTVPEIQYVEQLLCGPIANGNYWVDARTGLWGYAGDPRPRGHVAERCGMPSRRPSLSERGLLFSPHDWVR